MVGGIVAQALLIFMYNFISLPQSQLCRDQWDKDQGSHHPNYPTGNFIRSSTEKLYYDWITATSHFSAHCLF